MTVWSNWQTWRHILILNIFKKRIRSAIKGAWKYSNIWDSSLQFCKATVGNLHDTHESVLWTGCLENSRVGATVDLRWDAAGGAGDASVAPAAQQWSFGCCAGPRQAAGRRPVDLGTLRPLNMSLTDNRISRGRGQIEKWWEIMNRINRMWNEYGMMRIQTLNIFWEFNMECWCTQPDKRFQKMVEVSFVSILCLSMQCPVITKAGSSQLEFPLL